MKSISGKTLSWLKPTSDNQVAILTKSEDVNVEDTSETSQKNRMKMQVYLVAKRLV